MEDRGGEHGVRARAQAGDHVLRRAHAAVDVPVIASGGVGAPEHMVAGLRAGADAVLAASIFHYGEHSVAEVKDAIAGAGIPVRR